MYIRLLRNKRIEIAGETKVFARGDWVDVGKQTALLWIARGEADIPKFTTAELKGAGDAGVFLTNACEVGKSFLGNAFPETSTASGILRLPWEKTMIWDPSLPLQPHLVSVGFLMLDTWEVACPLLDYRRTAASVGSSSDRERTKAVIRDLRVPLYDHRLLFIRRTERTQDMIAVWHDSGEGDPRLALLRTLYRTKPLLLALPCTWSTPGKAPLDV